MTNDRTPGGFDPADHRAEAEARWGETAAYHESARRTAAYRDQDWEALGREAHDINRAFLELMAEQVPASSSAAAAIVDRHRQHISRWFYDCTPEVHAGLGQLYVQDARFTERIDLAGAGLARFMADAIAARYA